MKDMKDRRPDHEPMTPDDKHTRERQMAEACEAETDAEMAKHRKGMPKD
jgi:hypothetical protein